MKAPSQGCTADERKTSTKRALNDASFRKKCEALRCRVNESMEIRIFDIIFLSTIHIIFKKFKHVSHLNKRISSREMVS